MEIATTLDGSAYQPLPFSSRNLVSLDKREGYLQTTESKHAKDNKLLRAPNLQLLEIWHGEHEDDEIHDEVRRNGTDEPRPIVHTAVRVGDGFVPVGGWGDAVKCKGDVLFQPISNVMPYTEGLETTGRAYSGD